MFKTQNQKGLPGTYPGISSFYSYNLIMSSILKIVMAASVANLIDFTLDTKGSKTPALKLFLTYLINIFINI